MKVLLAITTANQLEYTIKIISSLSNSKPDYVDVVIFDDASSDGTIEWCKENNIEIVSKPESKGLTHSWNLAYKKFKDDGYNHLILSNNDLIIPKNSIENLINLNKTYTIVGPLSTKKGVGDQPLQNVREYYNFSTDEYNYTNTLEVQEHINSANLNPSFKVSQLLNGFIFSLNRTIISYELNDGNIFDPKNINVGNETELCNRVSENETLAIALNAYIFHFKGVSFQDINFDNQSIEFNIYRDLNWQEAQLLKKSPIKRFLFKLKRKFK